MEFYQSMVFRTFKFDRMYTEEKAIALQRTADNWLAETTEQINKLSTVAAVLRKQGVLEDVWKLENIMSVQAHLKLDQRALEMYREELNKYIVRVK